MFYDFIYLAKGFRMRPKVQSTLSHVKINHGPLYFDWTSATSWSCSAVRNKTACKCFYGSILVRMPDFSQIFGRNEYNLIFFMFIRFPAILLGKTIDSYLHEFCVRGILHSDFQWFTDVLAPGRFGTQTFRPETFWHHRRFGTKTLNSPSRFGTQMLWSLDVLAPDR